MQDERPAGLKRPRIPNEKRRECLDLFQSGCGYKMTASRTGLCRYTVREYLRRYKDGDTSWADRGSR